MEKLLSQIPGNENVKAEKVLEINPNHSLFNKLQNASDNDLEDLMDILYNQSLLIEGFNIENPLDFTKKINNLISK